MIALREGRPRIGSDLDSTLSAIRSCVIERLENLTLQENLHVEILAESWQFPPIPLPNGFEYDLASDERLAPYA